MFLLSFSFLSSVSNVSQNGSRLVQLDNDITEQVDRAQQAASFADTSASLALSLVRLLKRCVFVSGSLWQQVHQSILDVKLLPPSQMTCDSGSRAAGVCALPEYNLRHALLPSNREDSAAFLNSCQRGPSLVSVDPWAT